jgi:NAD-dependent dihydropyrimidine dehydrogenase PreA subunit
MCHFCVTHADGGKWYETARNYAMKMYRYQKEEARKKRAEFIEKKRAEVSKMEEGGLLLETGEGWYVDKENEMHILPGAAIDLDIMISDLADEVIEATNLGLESLPMVKQKAKSFMDKYHTMQVMTYEEAQHLLEITWPIGLMECICRRERRGMYNDSAAHTCFSLGVGLYKYERWPETFRGMTFLSVKEAKERLEYLHKKGCVHALTTFYTPYIGGLCSCEYPTCLGIRGRVDYDLNGIFYKGHSVAVPIMERCTGCGECVQFCQFGALSVSRSRNKLTINMQKCFGCAQCVDHCPNSALRMQDRAKTPGLKDSW